MNVRLAAVFFTVICFFNLAGAKVLDTLVIRGLTINSKDLVRNTVDLHEGSEFSAINVQESIKKLASLGLFRSIDAYVLRETDSSASLMLKLEEYPFCESIEYVGMKKFKQKDIEEKFPLKARQIATDNAVFRSQQHIKEQYAKKGYLMAEVSVERVPTKVPGNVILKFVIKEGPKVQIKNITFKGNVEVKSSKLKSKFKTKENRWWRSGDYEEDLYRSHLDSLIMFYNDLGYLDASIVKDSVWYADNKKDINIEITVDEGKKYYAGRFDFTGNTVIPGDSLAARIMLKEGKPFQKSRYDMSKYLMENVYREEGYLWVSIDEQKRFRGDTIDVTFAIYEGKPAIVRKIDIKGNTKTREKVIRREIDLLPGQRYRQSLMASSRQRVMSLNYFSDVKPDLTPNSDGTIDMVFEVTEKDNIGQFQIGAAYSQIDGFVGTLALSIPNFRGAGQELKIDLEAGVYRRAVDLGFKEPWAFDSPTSLSGEVFYNWTVPQYTSLIQSEYDTLQSYGFDVGVGRSRLSWPDDRFSVSMNYRLSFDQSSWGLDTSLPLLKVPRGGWLSKVSFSATRYDLDMPQFPTSGSKLTISPEFAGIGGAAISSLDFNLRNAVHSGNNQKYPAFSYFKGTLDYDHYFPLPLKLCLGSRTKLGIIQPLQGPITISRYDLFKIGGVYGDADLRGYKEYSFGGYNLYFKPDNGLNMFASTLELRYPLLEQQLYLSVFGDVGNTWPTISQISLGDLYKGVGVGVRLNIPMMGIMGFDFGWGLNDPHHTLFDGKPNGFEIHFLMNRPF